MVLKLDGLLPAGPDVSEQSDVALQAARSVVDEMS